MWAEPIRLDNLSSGVQGVTGAVATPTEASAQAKRKIVNIAKGGEKPTHKRAVHGPPFPKGFMKGAERPDRPFRPTSPSLLLLLARTAPEHVEP
jgi:hypothetical protein